MSRILRQLLNSNALLRLAVVLLAGGFIPSSIAGPTPPASELKLVVILTRHGVRSPLQTNQVLGKYAAEPWPEWKVAPGILTPHGREQMVQLGNYYRARYVAEGLLTGDAAQDAPAVFFRSNVYPRTRESALALAAGLLPGTGAPDLHTVPEGKIDPLFQPVLAGAAVPDKELAVAAVLGRVGNDLSNVTRAYAAEFATLQQVLGPTRGMTGKTPLLDEAASVEPGQADHSVGVKGPVRIGLQVTDALLLEYLEGLPMSEVGWGRLTPAMLTDVLKLHSVYFDLTQGTFYPAQVQASNFADHLRSTLDQVAQGRPVPGAFGTPAHKVIVVSGHDTNIVNFGGLLRLNWWVSGSQVNPILPGGALVVELRQRPLSGEFVVRMYYVSQTLEQIRALTPLSLENPPGVSPIFIPGCSESGPGYDVPLAKFDALLRRTIDPQFVTPGAP